MGGIKSLKESPMDELEGMNDLAKSNSEETAAPAIGNSQLIKSQEDKLKYIYYDLIDN